MGLSLNQSAAYMPESQQAPQTGMNPNPPAVTATSQPAGKGNSFGQPADATTPVGKGGGSSMTSSATSGQPQMGVPNQYSNTVQPMDNRRMGIAGMQARGKGQ